MERRAKRAKRGRKKYTQFDAKPYKTVQLMEQAGISLKMTHRLIEIDCAFWWKEFPELGR